MMWGFGSIAVTQRFCTMKRKLAIIFALIGWFAVIAQFILMLENRVDSIPETIVRFFSFFTILTNTLIAVYFTCQFFTNQAASINKPGILTAITTYIIIVCLVYQIALRHVWQPQGLQRIVDELLHSIIPVLVILFWYLYESTKSINYSQILKWAIFPFIYLIFILGRGRLSNFYPYPFIDVANIGIAKVLTNSAVILVLFLMISAILLFIGKSIIKR